MDKWYLPLQYIGIHLLVNELIVKFDGQKVTEFKEMIDIIKNKHAGDKVVIEIMRGVELLTKEAVLETWR